MSRYTISIHLVPGIFCLNYLNSVHVHKFNIFMATIFCSRHKYMSRYMTENDEEVLLINMPMGRSLFFQQLFPCLGVLFAYRNVMQVGDFGLSRLKHNTFLSSKSTAGTVSFLFLLFYKTNYDFSAFSIYRNSLFFLHLTSF